MAVAVLALLVGLAVGLLGGGSLERLGLTRLHARWLIAAAVLAELLAATVGGTAYPLGLTVAAVAALAFLARNRGLPGLGLLAAGLLLNGLAVLANGGQMPVSLHAAAVARTDARALATDPLHEPADAGTHLRALTDWIAVPLPGVPQVLSPGDVLVAAGLGLFGFSACRPPRADRG